MRRTPRSCSTGSRRVRSCTGNAASPGRSSTPGCRPTGRSPRPSAARASSSGHSRRTRRDCLGSMYGDKPDRWTPELEGIERLRFIVNCLTRLRFVDGKGRLVLAYKGTIEDAPRGAMPWFRHPERATRKECLRLRPLVGARVPGRAGPALSRHGLRLGRRPHGAEARPRIAARAFAVPQPSPGRRLISRRGPRRHPPTGCRSGPRSAGRCGCPPAGAECS